MPRATRLNHGSAQTRGPLPEQLVPIGVDLPLDGLLIGIATTTGLTQCA